MPYTLVRLAPGSYDLVLDGEIVGSVVEDLTARGYAKGWQAELLTNGPVINWPAPFTKPEHDFESFEAVLELRPIALSRAGVFWAEPM
jgi:hypothetical protein